VIGLEDDAAYTDGSSNPRADQNASVHEGLFNVHNRLDRSRLSYTSDRLLVYGTGGFAYRTAEQDLNVNLAGIDAMASTSFKTNEAGFAHGADSNMRLPRINYKF
jgi:opacity protein-like surface antigen